MRRHYNEKRNVDLILDKVSFPISVIQRKRKKPSKIKRILVLKFSGIGDGLLALPAIKSLNNKGYIIDIACSKENESIFKNQSFINEIHVFDINNSSKIKFLKFILGLRKDKYDICIDTSQSSFISAVMAKMVSKYSIGFKNLKSKSRNKFFDNLIKMDEKAHMIINYYSLFEDFNIKKNLKLIPPKISKEFKLNYSKNKRGYIGLHATGPLKYKVWPEKSYSLLIENLVKKGYSILLFGGPKEEKENDKIISALNKNTKKKVSNLSGKLKLEEVFYIMPKLKLFIANDGGPMHIAASFNIPVIGIFGAETPLRYAPFNSKSYSIYKPFKNGPIIKTYKLEWPNHKNFERPNKITVNEVLEVVNLIENKHL